VSPLATRRGKKGRPRLGKKICVNVLKEHLHSTTSNPTKKKGKKRLIGPEEKKKEGLLKFENVEFLSRGKEEEKDHSTYTRGGKKKMERRTGKLKIQRRKEKMFQLCPFILTSGPERRKKKKGALSGDLGGEGVHSNQWPGG